ncbi:MAG: RNA-guided pseudouridylation complex pseudouridine synthase subunit Cbf5 [Candidatus Aenigmatarchaeota archaeon]
MHEILTREECDTNYDYGRTPEKRSVEDLIKYGVINIDKPSGPTSHQVVAWVREILGLKKVGHAGTLDPMVTGVLLTTLENSCKAIPLLMHLDKEYVGVMRVHADISDDKISEAFEKFTGKIKQLPPVRSAVARRVRERTIANLEVIEIEGRDVLFRVECEAGTYVRKLIADIGKALGVGAHMAELRRVRVGNFLEKHSITLQELKDACWYYKNENNEEQIRKIIIPIETALETAGVKKVFIKDSAINKVCNGAPLGTGGICTLDGNIDKGDLIGMFSLKNELVAIGKALSNSDDMIKSGSSIVVATDRVVMKLGTYA